MILNIFEKNTGLRLGLIKTYDFIQYTDVFNGVGDFTIKIPYTEETFSLLTSGNYVLFDDEDMGVIKYRNKDIDDEAKVTIKGFMLNKLLEYRVLEKSKSYKGSSIEISRALVNDHFINSIDPNRNIKSIKLEENPSIDSEIRAYRDTGHRVGDCVAEVLELKKFGYKLVPIVTDYDETSETPTNISRMEFRVLVPTDRSYDNVERNASVTFSLELNNLQRLVYKEDDTDYASMAFVAGEGEGKDRTIIETGKLESIGIDRIEIYVDARDLQSQNVETGEVISPEEYKNLLLTRGETYLEDHKSFQSFSGQVVTGNMSYKYRKDFKNGDFVTLVDKQLNISTKAQITSIIHSGTQSGEKLDIVFGYEKSTIKSLLKRKGVV